MESEGIPVFRDIGIDKVQNLPLRPVEAHRRTRPLHSAVRHRDEVGLLRRRDSARRRAQSREAYVRRDLPRRRRPRDDGGVAGGRDEDACVRVAEGIDVFDSDERASPSRQRHVGRCAAAGRHDGAERPQHDQQRRGASSTTRSSSATGSTAPRISSRRKTTSSRIRCAALRCAGRTSFPTPSTASCRSTTAARSARGASSRS